MNYIIEKAKTVSLTGHRIVQSDFNVELLKKVINNLIKQKYNCFLVGMALGFDMLGFKVLEEMRKTENIKIVACIPCVDQPLRYTEKQRNEYERMLNSSDETIVLSDNYKKGCMQKRNEFMVDNSSVLVAYVRRERSGAGQTERYAKENNVKVINI